MFWRILRRTVARRRALALGAGAGLLAVATSACVSLDRRDAFPVAGPPLNLPALQAQAGPGGQVRPLRVAAVGGRPVVAYYVHHPDARGVLLFCGGSGNQVEATVRGLGPRTAALGLDLVVFSYYQEGEPIPAVAEVRAKARAVYTAVRALPTPAARSVYLLGYSLGGWFALDVAAAEGKNVRGLVLVGAETTPAEVIRRQYSPWANLVAIRPDEDARQLDAGRDAPRVACPTLVVTSRQDEAVPAVVGRELFGLLPAATPKRLVVLDGVTHGRYFLSDEFWGPFARFFGLPAGPGARHP